MRHPGFSFFGRIGPFSYTLTSEVALGSRMNDRH